MNKKQIEDLIYNYHWMFREVDRLEKSLYGSSQPVSSWGVAQYGIEATLPKGSKGKSMAELNFMEMREERLYQRLVYFQKRVYAVELMAKEIKDPQKLIILDCVMEGMSYRSIAAHLNVSRNKIRELKDEMLCQICQKCHFVHDLIKEKNIV